MRFIEYMPFDGNKWNYSKFVSYAEMLDVIKAQWPSFQRLPDSPNDTSKVFCKIIKFRSCYSFGSLAYKFLI